MAPAAPPSPPAPAVLNIDGTLKRLRCTRSFYREMLALFHLHDAGAALKLHAALDRGDRDAACRISHRLSGAASMLGAEELTAALTAIERELLKLPAAAQDLGTAFPAALLTQVEQSLQRTLAAAARELQSAVADAE